MLIVQKYGGTSLADPHRIRSAAARAAEYARRGNQMVVVVSAQGDTTDRLAEKIRSVSPDPDPREADACLSAGEQVCAPLMALAIRELGCDAVSLTGRQAGIRTDSAHGNACIAHIRCGRIRRELDRGRIVVVTGFQGTDAAGEITTLGRGGSDTTAVALAAWLKADLCQIYTDVEGIFDRDPRRFPDAVRFDRIGYERMLALIREGAQVLHDRSVRLAREYRVPVEVRSAFSPGPGTILGDLESL